LWGLLENICNADTFPLRDASEYVTELPKAEHDAVEWQAAMQALLLVVKHEGPAMFARIGVMKALNRHFERVFNSSEKDWRRVPRVSTAQGTVSLRLGFGERRGRAGRRAGRGDPI
jgi:hypothetical protein